LTGASRYCLAVAGKNRRDPAVTSRMMAAVRNKDTKAELALRRALHRRGLRYRLHPAGVFGRPDIAIRSRRLAVFADGDMWHGNAWRLRGLGRLEDMFPNNTEFWTKKIRRNIERDKEVTARLTEEGWTVVRLWESEILKDPYAAAERVVEALAKSEG
jgi:DNA mismatch endonuclease (patch repair protein)